MERAPCGCVKVGHGWNLSECTCPSLKVLMGPEYRWMPGRKDINVKRKVTRKASPVRRLVDEA